MCCQRSIIIQEAGFAAYSIERIHLLRQLHRGCNEHGLELYKSTAGECIALGGPKTIPSLIPGPVNMKPRSIISTEQASADWEKTEAGRPDTRRGKTATEAFNSQLYAVKRLPSERGTEIRFGAPADDGKCKDYRRL